LKGKQQALMRLASYATLAALCGCLLGVAPARADHQPALVVPGRADVPVIIEGHDAAGAVVEGDWGLYRPGHVTPTVFYPYAPGDNHWYTRGYYPFTGKRPRYGRYEIIPPANRRLPPQAESFHRYWSSDTAPVPAQTEYPAFTPPVILAPRVRSLN
jgi:hypothetical protein